MNTKHYKRINFFHYDEYFNTNEITITDRMIPSIKYETDEQEPKINYV